MYANTTSTSICSGSRAESQRFLVGFLYSITFRFNFTIFFFFFITTYFAYAILMIYRTFIPSNVYIITAMIFIQQCVQLTDKKPTVSVRCKHFFSHPLVQADTVRRASHSKFSNSQKGGKKLLAAMIIVFPLLSLCTGRVN